MKVAEPQGAVRPVKCNGSPLFGTLLGSAADCAPRCGNEKGSSTASDR